MALRGRPWRPFVLYIALWSAVLSPGVQLGAGGTTTDGGADTRIPCASLPEFQGIKDLPPIRGLCRPSGSSSEAAEATFHISSVEDAGSGDSSSGSSSSQRWIALWKKTGAAGLSLAACDEGEAAGSSGRFNATCRQRYSTAALAGIAAEFGSRDQVAEFLRAYGGELASVHADGAVSVQGVQRIERMGPGIVDGQIRWGLDRIDQAWLPLNGEYTYSSTGTGVHVYVVDTGIMASHQEFLYSDGTPGSRASEAYNALSGGRGGDSSTGGDDCEGHGTHVAAAIGGLRFGVAKNVTLHAVRTLDCSGDGAVSDVIAALDWLLANAQRPAVVTLSLGGEVQEAMDLAVGALTDAGIHVVVAAGNGDKDACECSPARAPTAVTVGASDMLDRRMWIGRQTGSNYGACVDIFAPGRSILSATSASPTATEVRSGTSQAVPYVAGVMALALEQHPSTQPLDMARLLEASASAGQLKEVDGSGFARVRDTGSPNLLLQSHTRRALTLAPAAGSAATLAVAGSVDAATGVATSLALSVSLGVQPYSDVRLALRVEPAGRGEVEPAELALAVADWQAAHSVRFTPNLYGSVDGSDIKVVVTASSADALYDGMQDSFTLVDRKGDTLSYPKLIPALPFSDTSSTFDYTGDYAACGSGGKDLLYYFNPQTSCNITVSLCFGDGSSSSSSSGQLAVLVDVDAGGQLEVAACSAASACGSSGQLSLELSAGVGYVFLVKGPSSSSSRQQQQFMLMLSTADGEAVAGATAPPLSLISSLSSIATGQAPGLEGDAAQQAGAAALQESASTGSEGSSSSSSDNGDSDGGSPTQTLVIAASVGSAAALALTGVVVAFVWRRHRRQAAEAAQAAATAKLGTPGMHPAELTRGRSNGAAGGLADKPQRMEVQRQQHVAAAAGVAAAATVGAHPPSGLAPAAYPQPLRTLRTMYSSSSGSGNAEHPYPHHHVVLMPSHHHQLLAEDTGTPTSARRARVRQRSPPRCQQ